MVVNVWYSSKPVVKILFNYFLNTSEIITKATCPIFDDFMKDKLYIMFK